MVAIVSGNSLGLSLTSLATLGQQGMLGNASSGRSGEKAYVNITTGNLVLQDRDELLVTRGQDAGAVRTYNSQGSLTDDNADNWAMGISNAKVRFTGTLQAAGSTVIRTDADGAEAVYTFNSTLGLYVSSDGAGAYDQIKYDAAASQLVWTDGDTGVSEKYQATGAGRLLSTTDLNGNTLTYAYASSGLLASVATASGETIYFDYSGTRLTQVRTVVKDGAGTKTLTNVRYAYNAQGRLSTVSVDLTPADNSVADGKIYTTSYTYDGTSARVATITQGDGTKLSFTYVLIGTTYRIASVTDGLGQITQFAYDTVNRRTTVTDPLGLKTVYEYDVLGQLTKTTRPAVNGVSSTTTNVYSASGDLLSVTDGQGRTVVMEYDANGNQTMQRDAAGNTVTRTFNGRNQLLTETAYVVPDPDGNGTQQPSQPLTTRYVYDAADRNQLRFVISAEGRVTEYRYSAAGEQIATVQYAAAQYAVAALAQTAVPTEATVATWAAAQNLSKTVKTDLVYDYRGQLQKTTTYAKVDASGNGVLDGTQAVTQYVYDQAGQVLKTIAAQGGVTQYVYDGLGRVVTTTNALNEVSVTQYDDANNRITVTQANGLSSVSAFDGAGRLTSFISTDAASNVLGVTQYFYDANDRLLMTQDPTGVRQWSIYDDAGRKAAVIDGNGSLTEFVYNQNGQVIQTLAYATAVNVAALVTAQNVPASVTLASIRPAVNAADRKTWNIYDDANRLVKKVDGIGAVTEYRYDGASRVVATLSYASVISTATLAASLVASNINPTAHATDRVARNLYDSDGLLRGTLDGEGYLTEYRYNAAGQRTETIGYANLSPAAARAAGALVNLIPAANGSDVRTVNLYNARGQLAGVVDGEGYLTETVYDENGNVARSVRYATKVAGTVATTAELTALRPVSTAEDQVLQQSFDALNRLVQQTNAQGVITKYEYDSAGNLVRTTAAFGTTEVRTLSSKFDLQGRLVAQLSAEGAALLTGSQTQTQIDAIWTQYGTAYSYDAAGRRTSATNAMGHKTLYFYDADSHLTHTVNALGEVEERQYSTLGQVSANISYGTRIPLTGLAGGLADSTLLTAVAAVRNSTLDSKISYTYNNKGAVLSELDAQGFQTTYVYTAFDALYSRTQKVDATRSVTQLYTYDRRGLQTLTRTDSAGLNIQQTTQYDAFGRAVRFVDGNGNVRTQAFDRLGRSVSARDPLNGLTQSTYDAFDRVLTEVDALGNTTRYAYSSANRTVTVTTPEGVSVVTTRTRLGQIQSVKDGRGNTTTYTYDRDGNLKKTATPLTQTSSLYDRANRLLETTDANGKKIAYTYDAADRVLTRTADTASLKLVTSYQYDAKGQQISVTDPTGTVTQLQFDLKGQVLRKTVDPTGLNLATVYTYDGRGKTLTVTSPGGSVVRYDYDLAGRLSKESVDPAGLNLSKTYAYDRNGNVLSTTDARGNQTRYVYDANDRVVFTLDALGNLKRNIYDAKGRVTQAVAYATPISLTNLPATPVMADIESRVVVSATADISQGRVYDKDDRLSWTVDGTGAVVQFVYDAAGNVVDRIAYAKRITPSAWTPGSVPVPTADATDARQRTVYDALNRAVFSIDGVGAVVARKYDGQGNVTERTAYAKAVPVATAVTSAALTAAVALIAQEGRDARTRMQYDGANRLNWSADGMGAVTRYLYDKNGNVTHKVVYATAVASTASASSVVASVADRVTAYAYDKANRQVFQVDALGGVTKQVFDANGNVVQRTAYAKPVTAPLTTAAVSIASLTASVSVDAVNDRNTCFAYDAANRPVFAVDALGAVTETNYDAAGNIVTTAQYANVIDATTLPANATAASIRAKLVANDAADRVQYAAYDAANKKVYSVDASGYVSLSQYDGVGRMTTTTAYALAIPGTAQRTLEGIAASIVATASKDQKNVYVYDAAGNLLSSQDPMGNSESYEYDALGRKLTFTNKLGAKWTYAYDSANRLINEVSPAVDVAVLAAGGYFFNDTPLEIDEARSQSAVSIVAKLDYDALGNILSRIEGFGLPGQRVTSYEYDALGRQIKTFFPPVYVYVAEQDNLISTVENFTAKRTGEVLTQIFVETYYDVFGDAVMGRDVAGNLKFKAYDKVGNVSFEVDSLGYVTGYLRNSFGLATSITRYAEPMTEKFSGMPFKASQVHAAINAGNVDHRSDRIIKTEYDRLGRVALITEPTVEVHEVFSDGLARRYNSGKQTRQVYNAFGELTLESKLKSTLDNSWSSTVHYYDKQGNKTATVDALGYLTMRQYDGVGNLTLMTEFATALAGWNASSLPEIAPGGVVNASNRTTTYVYDANNRKTQENLLNAEYSTKLDGTSVKGTLATRFAYDALGNVVSTTDASGAITYTAYDALGRIRAVTEHGRSVAGVSVSPLTVYRRDVHGNVVATIEYAAGGSSTDRSKPAATGVNDRLALTKYDAHGHAIQTTDATGKNTYASYDARGNLAKEWRGVKGNDNVTRNLFKAYEYDGLGRLTHVKESASTTVLRGGLQTTSTSAATIEDANGNLLLTGTNTIKLIWSGLIDTGGGGVRVQVDYQTKSTLSGLGTSESSQPVVSGISSHAATRTAEFSNAAAAAGVTLSWTDNAAIDGGIDRILYIRVWQQDIGGNWISKWDGINAQANGSGIASVTQDAAGLTDTSTEYNAFGEVVRRGVNGGRQEYYDYDNAGNIWKTNSVDGVDRIIRYDVQGRTTEEIRSQGAVNIQSFTNAYSASVSQGVARKSFIYDDLGRVVKTLMPSRQEVQGGVSVQAIRASSTINSTAVPRPGGGGFQFMGMNSVDLSWTSLAALGSEDVKVILDYVGIYNGATNSREQNFSGADAATGVKMTWAENSGPNPSGGISKINRFRVFKKDVVGQWVQVVDSAKVGNSTSNEILVSPPADPYTKIELKIRLLGSVGETGWATVPMIDFGTTLRYDAYLLPAGDYEYRVLTTTRNGNTQSTAMGNLRLQGVGLASISTPFSFGPAGAGFYAWNKPTNGEIQTFRYRSVNDVNSWTTATIINNSNAYNSVDVRNFPAGDYLFELLWTRSGETDPYAHATGVLNIIAATPAQNQPAVNLPNIQVRSEKVIIDQSLSSAEVSAGAVANILEWPKPDDGEIVIFRYRVGNGEWKVLPISEHQKQVTFDESGQMAYASMEMQRVNLASLLPGTYEFEVLSSYPWGSRILAQAFGNLIVSSVNSNYWETRNVGVTRVRSVTPLSPVNYIAGLDESGKPIYRAPVTLGYTESGQPIFNKGYGFDQQGNVVAIPYDESYTVYEKREFLVDSIVSLKITTPPYTPSYIQPAKPIQLIGNVTTVIGSAAISLPARPGSVLEQKIIVNEGTYSFRPSVFQDYDRWGNVVSLTDPRNTGWKTTYRYNFNNQIIEERKPDENGAQGANSPVTQIFYDQLGRQVALRDARGYVNAQMYNVDGNVVEERHADGGVIKYEYSTFGDKTKVTDAMGNVTSNTFDKAGRLLSSTHGTVNVYTVNASMALTKQTAQAITESFGYDAAGRLLWQTNGAGEKTSYVYDPRNNIVEVKLAGGQITRSVFDTHGRKLAELDANNIAATWSYDYFGLLTGHTDLGGAKFTYTYNNARQLTKQTSTRGQNITHSYDSAGQLIRSLDTWVKQESLYSYDASGRRVREITRSTTNGTVYQDNHLAYDAQGNLRDVSDGRVHVVIDYDKVGNRSRISTSVINSADQNMASNRYFTYDSMNRQTTVDGVTASGAINASQGHKITYDKNGNRLTDTTWGKKVTVTQQQTGAQTTTVWGQIGTDYDGMPFFGYTESSTPIYKNVYNTTDGEVTEAYKYDALNRLETIKRDGIVTDTRYYDQASRVVQTGPNGSLHPRYVAAMNNGGIGNGSETRISRYDASGRLQAQRVLKSDNTRKYDMAYSQYDNAGNLLNYSLTNHDGGSYTNTFTNTLVRYEGYKESKVDGTSTKFQSGATTNQYDANGNLTGITDATKAANNRTFVNDAQGHALLVNQGGRIQRQLVVNGEVLGRYGEAVDAASTNGSFIQIADFNFGYQPISGNYPSASPGVYSVLAGDTLKSIAQGAYGDSKLWYRIAEANGLTGDSDLRVGQVLNVPSGVGSIHNDGSVFKPYDPTKITGDTTPNLPVPAQKGGCGGIGSLIMVAVAVAATIVTAGAAAAAIGSVQGSLMSVGASALMGGTAVGGVSMTAGVALASAAIGGAVGSIVSQGVGMAIGAQDSFSWKGVALSSLSAAAASGMGGAIGVENQVGNAMARNVLGNVATQGVAVVTGLQSSFNWRGVAAAAAGGAVGQQVGQYLGTASTQGFDLFARSATTGVAAGMMASLVKGGKLSMQQVATDAFGNALGQSLAAIDGQAASTSSATGEDQLGIFIEQNHGNWNHRQANYDQMADAFGNPTLYGRAEDVLLAAGPGYSGGAALSDRDRNLVRMLEMAKRPDAGSIESIRQPDGIYRVEIAGVGSTGLGIGADSIGGSLVDQRMTQTEMKALGAAQGKVEFTAELVDQQIQSGTYNAFNAIGDALANGQIKDAWRYATYTPSNEARAAAVERIYPQPSSEAHRISTMLASPAGAIAWGVARLSGASPQTQDGMLQTVATLGQAVGAGTGVYKQTLTAPAPNPSTAARVRNVPGTGQPPELGTIPGAKRNVVEFLGLEVRAVRDLSHVNTGTLQAMQKYGFAAKDANGNSLILHHHRQNPAGPIIEMPAVNHSIGNLTQHPFGNAKGVGLTKQERAEFDQWRVDYWSARATRELQNRGVK